MEWLIVLIIVVAVVAVAVLVLTQTRSARLRRQFGPEYERLVAEEGDRRQAEARLRERQERHDELDLHELSPQAAAAYTAHWQDIQVGFVDDPATSLDQARELVHQVARDRGYPMDGSDEGIEMVSVDHPRVVQRYREARAVEDAEAEQVALDDMRSAFRSYRALFNELLGDHQPGRQGGPRAAQVEGER
jgi:hypothetical protein